MNCIQYNKGIRFIQAAMFQDAKMVIRKAVKF